MCAYSDAAGGAPTRGERWVLATGVVDLDARLLGRVSSSYGLRGAARLVGWGDARGRSPRSVGSPSGTTLALTFNPALPGWGGRGRCSPHLRGAGLVCSGVDREPPRPRYLPLTAEGANTLPPPPTAHRAEDP